MSGYRGRPGPNLSQFLNNLNVPYDQEQFAPEDIDLNQDLAMFTNTDFTHFDIPAMPEDVGFGFDLSEGKNSSSVKYEELLGSSDSIQSYGNPALEPSTGGESSQYFGNYPTPIQPAPVSSAGFGRGESHASPSNSASGAGVALRRVVDAGEANGSSEENSRRAAEEDKRRRNTAASARFRVKKKQREQALERTVKDVQDKNSKLEARISQLEVENKWLKELITEKNGPQSKEEMAAAFQKFRKESEERELRSSEHTTGVGTE